MQPTDSSGNPSPQIPPLADRKGQVPATKRLPPLTLLLLIGLTFYFLPAAWEIGWALHEALRPPRFTAETYASIQEGMSRTDVHAILGPAGDSRTRPTVSESLTDLAEMWHPEAFSAQRVFRWESNAAIIFVAFDTSGNVIGKSCFRSEGLPLTIWVWDGIKNQLLFDLVLSVLALYFVYATVMSLHELFRRPRFTTESFANVRYGMSRAGVEALFGPGDDFGPETPRAPRVIRWEWDTAIVDVTFDSSGNVIGKRLVRSKRSNHTVWNAVEDWWRKSSFLKM
jgi:hypothetical protein